MEEERAGSRSRLRLSSHGGVRDKKTPLAYSDSQSIPITKSEKADRERASKAEPAMGFVYSRAASKISRDLGKDFLFGFSAQYMVSLERWPLTAFTMTHIIAG